MARTCPACGRPNGDAATKCLYCLAPLPAVESLPPAPVETAPASGDRHLLILLPTEARPSVDEASIVALSRIASVSAYDARLSLSSPRPRLFRRLDTEGDARRFSEELSAARIPHYVVPEASVTALPVARASAIDPRERHFEMVLPGASPSLTPAPYEELLLLVRGEITRERHDERKLGSTKGASRRLTPGMRLHLYLRDASVAVEIDPDLFDFRILKDEKTASALLNFEKLIACMLEKARGLAVDRGFDQEPLVLSRAGGAGDVTDALAAGDGGPSGVPYDDEANFRFYARWRYRVARHLSLRDSG